MKMDEFSKKDELKFLIDLSKVLEEEQDFNILSKKTGKLFSFYFKFCKTRFVIKDDQSSLLKLLGQSNSCLKHQISYSELRSKFPNIGSADFIINEKLLRISEDLFSDTTVVEFFEENNVLYFPMIVKENIVGFFELTIDNNIQDFFNYNFVATVLVASAQIASVIELISLNYQMQTNARFHSAMKNIAKIIESQYEFAYIVPLIGEMIDRFISEHLIYVFMKNDQNEFKLIWPALCNDRDIYKLLGTLKNKTNYFLSKDKKIGVFPLLCEKGTMGAIVAYSNIEQLLDSEVGYILELSKQASITIQKAEMYAEVLKHAALDALTGLNNRRQFEVRLGQEIATAKRKNLPLCCIMVDVDYFKQINDTYGHIAGDCILKGLSKLLIAELREYDIASRYGGEEFCILLPATTIEEASFVAKRLRKATEMHEFDVTEAKIPSVNSLKVTISLGVSQYTKDMVDAVDLYKKADIALYDAKKSGRNKVIVCKD